MFARYAHFPYWVSDVRQVNNILSQQLYLPCSSRQMKATSVKLHISLHELRVPVEAENRVVVCVSQAAEPDSVTWIS